MIPKGSITLQDLVASHTPLPEGKCCGRCSRYKALTDFYADPSKRDGKRLVCRVCDNKRRRKRPKRRRITEEEKAQRVAAKVVRTPYTPEQRRQYENERQRKRRAAKRALKDAQQVNELEAFRRQRAVELEAAMTRLQQEAPGA